MEYTDIWRTIGSHLTIADVKVLQTVRSANVKAFDRQIIAEYLRNGTLTRLDLMPYPSLFSYFFDDKIVDPNSYIQKIRDYTLAQEPGLSESLRFLLRSIKSVELLIELMKVDWVQYSGCIVAVLQNSAILQSNIDWYKVLFAYFNINVVSPMPHEIDVETLTPSTTELYNKFVQVTNDTAYISRYTLGRAYLREAQKDGFITTAIYNTLPYNEQDLLKPQIFSTAKISDDVCRVELDYNSTDDITKVLLYRPWLLYPYTEEIEKRFTVWILREFRYAQYLPNIKVLQKNLCTNDYHMILSSTPLIELVEMCLAELGEGTDYLRSLTLRSSNSLGEGTDYLRSLTLRSSNSLGEGTDYLRSLTLRSSNSLGVAKWLVKNQKVNIINASLTSVVLKELLKSEQLQFESLDLYNIPPDYTLCVTLKEKGLTKEDLVRFGNNVESKVDNCYPESCLNASYTLKYIQAVWG
jgi:hypothetical protein